MSKEQPPKDEEEKKIIGFPASRAHMAPNINLQSSTPVDSSENVYEVEEERERHEREVLSGIRARPAIKTKTFGASSISQKESLEDPQFKQKNIVQDFSLYSIDALRSMQAKATSHASKMSYEQNKLIFQYPYKWDEETEEEIHRIREEMERRESIGKNIHQTHELLEISLYPTRVLHDLLCIRELAKLKAEEIRSSEEEKKIREELHYRERAEEDRKKREEEEKKNEEEERKNTQEMQAKWRGEGRRRINIQHAKDAVSALEKEGNSGLWIPPIFPAPFETQYDYIVDELFNLEGKRRTSEKYIQMFEKYVQAAGGAASEMVFKKIQALAKNRRTQVRIVPLLQSPVFMKDIRAVGVIESIASISAQKADSYSGISGIWYDCSRYLERFYKDRDAGLDVRDLPMLITLVKNDEVVNSQNEDFRENFVDKIPLALKKLGENDLRAFLACIGPRITMIKTMKKRYLSSWEKPWRSACFSEAEIIQIEEVLRSKEIMATIDNDIYNAMHKALSKEFRSEE